MCGGNYPRRPSARGPRNRRPARGCRCRSGCDRLSDGLRRTCGSRTAVAGLIAMAACAGGRVPRFRTDRTGPARHPSSS